VDGKWGRSRWLAKRARRKGMEEGGRRLRHEEDEDRGMVAHST
jgi:hypothetical protein